MARGKPVETKFKTSGQDKMMRQLRGLERQLGDISKAGKNLKDGLSRASVGLGLSIAGFEAMKFAAEAATDAIRGVLNVMRELSARGGDVSSIAADFERVGSPEVLRNLELFSAGMVNNTELMRTYNSVVEAGILSSQQAAQGISLTLARARQSGEDMEKMLRAFRNAATGRGAEAFGDMGVAVTALNNEVSRLGVSSESAAGKQEVLRRIMLQFGEALEGTTIQSGHTQDALQEVIVVYENMRDEAARAFAENQELTNSLSAIAARIRPLIPAAVRFGVILAQMAEIMLQMAAEAAPSIARAFQQVLRVFEVVTQATSDWVGMLGGRTGQLNRMVTSLGDMRLAVGQLGDAFEATGQRQAAFFEQVPPMLDASAFAQPDRAAMRASRRGGGQQREEFGLFDEIGATQDEIATRNEFEQELHDQRMERLSAEKDAEIEQSEKHAEERALELEHFEAMKEAEIELAEKARETAAAARERLKANANTAAEWGGVVNNMLGTVGGTFGALADAKQRDLDSTRQAMRAMGKTEQEITAATKQREKAVEKARKAEGAFLVAQNIVLAATEIARAIGAIPNPVLIASHAASAAAHIVAAGIAASRLGGGGGGAGASVPSMPSVETFAPAAPEEVQSVESTGPTQTNVVNYYSLGRSGEDLGRALREAEFEFERSDGRAVGGMGVSYS